MVQSFLQPIAITVAAVSCSDDHTVFLVCAVIARIMQLEASYVRINIPDACDYKWHCISQLAQMLL